MCPDPDVILQRKEMGHCRHGGKSEWPAPIHNALFDGGGIGDYVDAR